jgi:hypothetical protein
MNNNTLYARNIEIDKKNKQQCKEIKDIDWFDYEQAQSKIRHHNVERKELLKRLHSMVLKTLH